jgi:hypothetical protein
VLCTPTFAVAAWRRLTLFVVDGHTPIENLERLRTTVLTWVKQHPEKTVSLIVLYPTPEGMSAEERAVMTRLMKETHHTRLASATVVMAEGILGALHRSILTGLTFVAPPPHPAKVFATVSDALRWVGPRLRDLSVDAPLEVVEELVRDLRQQILRAREPTTIPR